MARSVSGTARSKKAAVEKLAAAPPASRAAASFKADPAFRKQLATLGVEFKPSRSLTWAWGAPAATGTKLSPEETLRIARSLIQS